MNTFKQSSIGFLLGIAAFHEKFGLEQSNQKVAVAELPEGGFATERDQAEWESVNRDRMHPEEWELRHKRLTDEVDEYIEAVEAGDDEATLDALVDIVYIALGTAYRRGWDFEEAWNRVQAANMAKERGKPNNSKYGSGFDIVKPEGWTAPSHADLV